MTQDRTATSTTLGALVSTMNMQFITLAYFYLLTSITFAQEVDWQDIPGVCYSVCWEVASLSQGCAYTNGNNYIDCVCNNDVAPRWIPNCQACIAAVWRKDTSKSKWFRIP